MANLGFRSESLEYLVISVCSLGTESPFLKKSIFDFCLS
jgi:hypothetical protein